MFGAIIAFVVIQTSAALGGASVYFDAAHRQPNQQVLEHVEKQVQSSGAMDPSMTVTPETQRREEQRILEIIERK
jgi:hypothetical protein